MRIPITALLVSLLLLQAIAARAALIDHGNYFSDDVAGLDWLKLSETINLGYTDVLSLTGSGGLLDGWQYATGSQFDQLLSGQGLGGPACGNGAGFCGLTNGLTGLQGLDLINLFGNTNQGAYPYPIAVGMLADTDINSGYQWSAQIFVDGATMDPTQQVYADTYGWALPTNYESGSWLVRVTSATAVPAPAALSLFMIGTAALMTLRKPLSSYSADTCR